MSVITEDDVVGVGGIKRLKRTETTPPPSLPFPLHTDTDTLSLSLSHLCIQFVHRHLFELLSRFTALFYVPLTRGSEPHQNRNSFHDNPPGSTAAGEHLLSAPCRWAAAAAAEPRGREEGTEGGGRGGGFR